MTTKVTLSKGGTKERTIEVGKIQIPDLWHIALSVRQQDTRAADQILQVWNLAHDLKRHIAENS